MLQEDWSFRFFQLFISFFFHFVWWFEGSFWCLLEHNPQNPLDLLFRLEIENRAERTQCASSFCGFGSCIFHLLCTCSFLPYVSLPISISPLFRLIGLCSRHCTKQMCFLSFCYGANSRYEPLCFVGTRGKKSSQDKILACLIHCNCCSTFSSSWDAWYHQHQQVVCLSPAAQQMGTKQNVYVSEGFLVLFLKCQPKTWFFKIKTPL